MEGKKTKRSRAPRQHVLALPAYLDIAHAGELKQLLDTALTAKPPVVLDAAAVEQVDAAGLQVLLAFQCARPAHGPAAAWRNPSDTLREAATLTGLVGALSLETAPNS